jgi:hypothetical protein
VWPGRPELAAIREVNLALYRQRTHRGRIGLQKSASVYKSNSPGRKTGNPETIPWCTKSQAIGNFACSSDSAASV